MDGGVFNNTNQTPPFYVPTPDVMLTDGVAVGEFIFRVLTTSERKAEVKEVNHKHGERCIVIG